MSNDTIYDALENCLQALDKGETIESCLARYPKLADELRPILDAAIQARSAAVADVPVDVARRGRARVLQAAAEMREQRNVAPVLPFWRRKSFFGPRFYRLAATTAVVVIFLLTGGTGLVNASSGALPGDQLYPVKRGWEGVQLAFVFDQHAKANLETKFEQERKSEIEELYTAKRFEQVTFEGVVESQQPNVWSISGLDVVVEAETVYSGQIVPGAIVQVIGETDDGVIKAGRITLISAPSATATALSSSTPMPIIIQSATPEKEEQPESTQAPETGEDSGSGESKTAVSTATSSTSEKSGGEDQSGYSSNATAQPREDKSSSGGSTGAESTQTSDSNQTSSDSGGSDH